MPSSCRLGRRSASARATASAAVSPWPSAPISVAHAWVVDAPPTITKKSLLLPAATRCSITSLCCGMVVVMRAQTAMIVARASMAAVTNLDAGTSTPRSITSKPAVLSIVVTMFLPREWMSPLTVPMTTLPLASACGCPASSGSSTSIPACQASAASIISGRKTSSRRNISPTSRIPATSPSSSRARAGSPSSRPSWTSSGTRSKSASVKAVTIARERRVRLHVSHAILSGQALRPRVHTRGGVARGECPRDDPKQVSAEDRLERVRRRSRVLPCARTRAGIVSRAAEAGHGGAARHAVRHEARRLDRPARRREATICAMKSAPMPTCSIPMTSTAWSM